MRKIGLYLALAFLLSGIGSSAVSAQSPTKGRVIIDLYYGYPNLWTATLRTIVNQGVIPIDLKTSSLGPMGGRAEYMVTDHIGLGLDIYYAKSGASFSATGPDLNGNEATYAYEFTLLRPRFLGRFNFHFGDLERLDPYVGLGLGYNASRIRIKTDDPIFNQNEFSFPIFLPVAFRLALGTRVMFNNFLGFNVEIGAGGPLLTTGFTLRI